MTSCDDRQSLVEQLLTEAVNMDQLLTVVKLLRSWPDPVYAAQSVETATCEILLSCVVLLT